MDDELDLAVVDDPEDVADQGRDEAAEEGAIPAEANYRPAADPNTSCAACDHYAAGDCELWDVPVDDNYTCDEFESDTEGPQEDENVGGGAGEGPTLAEFFYEGGASLMLEDGVWKPILRTGRWKVRPGVGGQPLRKPLIVTLDGPVKKGQVVLGELLRAFKEGAKQHVTLPLSHENRTEDNTGFIDDLKIEDDPEREGEHVLLGLHRFTDDDTRKKTQDGTIANRSAGIKFGFVRKSDGMTFPMVLDHVCLTNSPWLDGLEPFGANLAEDGESDVLFAQLESSQQHSEERRGGEHMGNTETETTTTETTSVLEDELGLSAEEIRDRLQRYDDLEERMHIREVEDVTRAWQEAGVPPAVCVAAKQLMLADDGGPALLLSEEGKDEPSRLTATEIVKRVVETVPKLDLHDRVTRESTAGERPDDDTDKELSLEERADDALAWLEGNDAPKREKKDEE